LNHKGLNPQPCGSKWKHLIYLPLIKPITKEYIIE
jgi:hypothetical protein